MENEPDFMELDEPGLAAEEGESALSNLVMPEVEDLYEFLKREYRHTRFAGRDNNTWGNDYSRRVMKHHIERLENYGFSMISRHDAKNPDGIKFDRSLGIIPEQNNQADYPRNHGHLTHLF